MHVGKSAFRGVSRHSDVIMADKTRRRNAALIHLSFLTSSKVSFNVSYQLCQLKAGGSVFPTVPGAAAGRIRSATGSIASALYRVCRPGGCCCEPLSLCNLLSFYL